MSVGEVSDRTERPPYVRFERRGIEDKQASLREGRYIAKDVDFALITPPYSKDLIEIKVESWLANERQNAKNNRIPAEWVDRWEKGYELFKQGEEMPPDGTPVKGWGAVSPAQEKMILHAGIMTIEDLAACNDEGLRRLGMGGRDLVMKAKSWLNSVKDHGKVALQNAALEKENEQLKITLESLEEKVAILARQIESKAALPDDTTQIVSRETITAADILEDEPVIDSQDISREQLKAMYKEKFGRRAHPRSSDETLKAKLGL